MLDSPQNEEEHLWTVGGSFHGKQLWSEDEQINWFSQVNPIKGQCLHRDPAHQCIYPVPQQRPGTPSRPWVSDSVKDTEKEINLTIISVARENILGKNNTKQTNRNTTHALKEAQNWNSNLYPPAHFLESLLIIQMWCLNMCYIRQIK